MPEALLTYIPSYFTRKGIRAFLGVLFLAILLFINHVLPIQWILFNIVEILIFFGLSSKLSLKWSKLSATIYAKRLYRNALLIRIIWVIFSYFFFIWMTGKPFEFETADAAGYHGEGIWLVNLLKQNQFEVYLKYIGKNYSDMGYPFYLGVLYYMVGESIIIPRLIKALLSSYMCLLVYKITRNNFGEVTGRMAGIMTMLLPNLIYYCGLHVKETEMVFLTVCFVYQADKLIRNRAMKFFDVFWLLLALGSLFFFRTVLAGCLVGSLVVATFLTAGRSVTTVKRIGVSLLLIIVTYFIANSPLAEQISEYVEGSSTNLSASISDISTRESGNKLARYGSRSVFLPFMLIVPLPTIVDTKQENIMMLGGAYFTRNIYAFFVFVALWKLYKRKQLREHILLLSFVFSYIFVLASSGFALSERFHLPLAPFLLILAAYGISQINHQNKKLFVPYLVMVVILVIGWNWFKLAGRGLG